MDNLLIVAFEAHNTEKIRPRRKGRFRGEATLLGSNHDRSHNSRP
jgi:hypothetical protein